MAAIQEFITDILLDAPNVPRPVAIYAIRNALNEFCRESHIWQVDVWPVAIGASEKVIAVVPDDTSLRVLGIKRAWLNNNPLPVKTEHEMGAISTTWESDTGDQLTAVVQVSASEIAPYPVRNDLLTDTLKLRVSVMPTDETAEIDDEIFDQWFEGIAAGAKARLLMMPDKPWSSPERSQVHEARFRQYKSRAKLRAVKGYGGGAMYASGKLPGVV